MSIDRSIDRSIAFHAFVSIAKRRFFSIDRSIEAGVERDDATTRCF